VIAPARAYPGERVREDRFTAFVATCARTDTEEDSLVGRRRLARRAFLREEKNGPLRGVREERLDGKAHDGIHARALDRPGAELRPRGRCHFAVREHDRQPPSRGEPPQASLQEKPVSLHRRAPQVRDLEPTGVRRTRERRVGGDDVRRWNADARSWRQAVFLGEAIGIEAACDRQKLRHTDGSRVDVVAPRVDAGRGSRVQNESARPARRIDEALAVCKGERTDRKVHDMARRKELPLLPFAHTRNELLEERVDPLRVFVEPGAIEQLDDGAKGLVRDRDANERTETRPRATRLAKECLGLATADATRVVSRLPRTLRIEARERQRKRNLERVRAARRKDELLDTEKHAPGALRKAGAAGHQAASYNNLHDAAIGVTFSIGMDPKLLHAKLAEAAGRFVEGAIDTRGGSDPVAALYGERRAGYSLFSLGLSDADCEALRPYLFGRPIPRRPGERPVACLHLIDGAWTPSVESVPMASLADRRILLFEIARARDAEVRAVLDRAHAFWTSLEWAKEGLAYRKHVVKNFSRLLEHYYEECLDELRQQIPKTRLEADKDFWEAKRAADHLEGNAEKAMAGETVPVMLAGQSYWKDAYVPAGVCVVITPMNFIYGIPGIQIVGCYLSGSPLIFKGHPFAGITNNTLVRMMIAAGADPRSIHKLEGFGGDLTTLTEDPRVAVVSVTGSAETAKLIQAGRGVRPVKFEGGGCNWAFLDDGYTDDELGKIAVRLTYSKLGFGSHKCTSLHGIAASPETLDRIEPLLAKEFAAFSVKDPRSAAPTEVKVVSPLMVHKASTLVSLQEAARAAGVRVLVEGGARTDDDYGKNAEVVTPVLLGRVTAKTHVRVAWDDKGTRDIALATTEFFMPILVTMETPSFEDFVHFCLVDNPHDLAVSLWTRDETKLLLARRTLAGMVKENDGTDSALEWEEFGASGVGESGNTGVGDAETTIAMFCRKQKGRHFVF